MTQASSERVAVRIIDKHGHVARVRVGSDGRAFIDLVEVTKSGTILAAVNLRVESPDRVRNSREVSRAYLDDVPVAEVTTYCEKGRHPVHMEVRDLQLQVDNFKRGTGAPMKWQLGAP